MKNLTEKQKNILDFIEDFLDREGMAPTVYEIADYFGIKTSTVFAHLKALQRKNQLQRSSKARSIALTARPRVAAAPARHVSFCLPIPVLGRINAGCPADSPVLASGKIYVGSNCLNVSAKEKKELFALQVIGQSMRDLGIYEDDFVVVNPAAEIRPGDVVAALVNNETTVKSYFPREDGMVELHPANPEFQVQVYPAEEVSMQGKVVFLQRKF